jgi:hypothetical protein
MINVSVVVMENHPMAIRGTRASARKISITWVWRLKWNLVFLTAGRLVDSGL